MIAQSLPEIWPLLNSAGVVGVLVLIVYGSVREWWVSGKRHRESMDECKVEKNEWKRMALGNIQIAERTATVAERAVNGTPEPLSDQELIRELRTRGLAK